MIRKPRISVFLMVLTILVITAFQGYWLYKNYRDEKRFFTGRTNMLFRETVFRLQTAKLHLDSNIKVSVKGKAGIVAMANVLKDRHRDSQFLRKKIDAAVININDNTWFNERVDTVDTRYVKMDSGLKKIWPRRAPGPGERVFDFLLDIDSLQTPVTVQEIRAGYRAALQEEEQINIPFKITSIPTDRRMLTEPPDPEDNKVIIGFRKPVTLQLDFDNSSLYILKKLTIPILVSVLLVGVTIISFLLLYRNLLQQRRLTLLKNDFISNITHELKTPIATVSVAVEALKSFNALQDPQRTQEYLDISASELQRLSLLVDKVLRLSMFENRRIELNKEEFDMKALVEEVINSIRLQTEKLHAHIILQAEGPDFMLHADKLHIASVLYNLLDNALKYSKEDIDILVTLERTFDIIKISVADNGIGIAPEYRQKVFDKFFRVPNSGRHNVKGYGLGLSYVNHIVRLHLGIITVKSVLGKGSTFIIELPVKETDVIHFDERRKAIKKTPFGAADRVWNRYRGNIHKKDQ